MKNTRLAFAIAIAALLVPALVRAHCDSLDGPVIADARTALKTKSVAPLLKWVKPQDEARIRAAFQQTLAVRQLGAEAQELADNYFFETLVRVHRAGEGAAYTGLKPAGTMLPVIREADEALDGGSVDTLAKTIGEHAAQGVRERFARATKAKAHAADNAAAGREYVEAYVAYIHYVEGLANIVHGKGHHEEAAEAELHKP
jgi:UDP-2,3-diacylglucosamine pyrophosphatase LpxH